MKVAILSRSIFKLHSHGGMEKYVYFFSKHLAENDVLVEIITSPTNKNRIIQDLENIKITFLPPNINDSNYTRPVRYRLFLKNAANYLKQQDIDILHAFGMAPPEYLKFRHRKPVVIQPFGSEEFIRQKKENMVKKIYLDIFMRNPKTYCLQESDAIASEGEIQTQEIIDLFKVPREKIFLLPDGVDLNEIERYLENVKITKEDLGLQDADIVLMNINRLAENKGVSYLVDALKILNEKLNVKLIIVGTGSEEEKIKRQIRNLDLDEKILHFKNIPDEKMFQLYTLADISVTPTLYEGLPLVILEAMACGKSIVASNVSEVPQVVKNGENGFLVPPGNPKTIANAVLRIYNENLFKKMGKRSREIVKNYDWSIIAQMAMKKYKELIKK